jgi:hypothetical protein
VARSVGVLVEVSDLLLVNRYRQYLLLLEFVRVVLVTLDDHEAVVLVQSDLGRHQEYLWEEVLLLQQLLVVRLLQLPTFISHRTYNNIQKTQPPSPTPTPKSTILTNIPSPTLQPLPPRVSRKYARLYIL